MTVVAPWWAASITCWSLLWFSHTCTAAAMRYAILLARDASSQRDSTFCLKYYPDLYNLTDRVQEEQALTYADFLDFREGVNCTDESSVLAPIAHKLPLVAQNGDANCTVAEWAKVAQSQSALALLADPSVSSSFNASLYSIEIPTASMVLSADVQSFLRKVSEGEKSSQIFLYAPPTPDRRVDCSVVIIFFMAVFAVSMGSLWSGYTKHYIRLRASSGGPGAGNDPAEPNVARANATATSDLTQEEDVSLKLTIFWVAIVVALMCAMLVLMYFFFGQLVYAFMGMFMLASIIATYSCLEPAVMWTYVAYPNLPVLQLPRCNLYFCVMHLELRQFILLLGSIALAVVWVVFRKEDWAWMLQDLLGIMFSINMLRVIRMPSFKICFFLLSVLFVYDIFFVFLTPFFTKDGKSIMEEVATGGDSGEQLPMVLKVPQMDSNPYHVCYSAYSMLGFGDLLVPGLLLSFCHSFDLFKGTPMKVYWLVANIFYAVSLLVCFTALFLMKKAQPALIYIVPLTLVPMVLVSLIRGEFKEFWEGDKDHHRQRSHQDGEEQEEQQQDGDTNARSSSPAPRVGSVVAAPSQTKATSTGTGGKSAVDDVQTLLQ